MLPYDVLLLLLTWYDVLYRLRVFIIILEITIIVQIFLCTYTKVDIFSVFVRLDSFTDLYVYAYIHVDVSFLS